jgi:hypothetical protein
MFHSPSFRCHSEQQSSVFASQIKRKWSGITSLTCNNGTEDDILVTNKAKVTDNSIAKLPFPKDKQQELKQSTEHS